MSNQNGLIVTPRGITSPELRKIRKAHFDACDKIWETYQEERRQYDYDLQALPLDEAADRRKNKPKLPSFPATPKSLAKMICGAKTRRGEPCGMTVLYRNGRCKFHGGASTGPTTAKGKRKAALNGNAPKRKRSS
jgi:hypothetical protein